MFSLDLQLTIKFLKVKFPLFSSLYLSHQGHIRWYKLTSVPRDHVSWAEQIMVVGRMPDSSWYSLTGSLTTLELGFRDTYTLKECTWDI